jgi:phage shock protein PspC (stress-responsive transcriptional regulator)
MAIVAIVTTVITFLAPIVLFCLIAALFMPRPWHRRRRLTRIYRF